MKYYENFEREIKKNWNQFKFLLFIIDLPEYLDCRTLSLPEPGSDYVGTVSTTRSGLRCQNWQDQRPHRHNSQSVGNDNYCRNLGFDSTAFGAILLTQISDGNTVIRFRFVKILRAVAKGKIEKFIIKF